MERIKLWVAMRWFKLHHFLFMYFYWRGGAAFCPFISLAEYYDFSKRDFIMRQFVMRVYKGCYLYKDDEYPDRVTGVEEYSIICSAAKYLKYVGMGYIAK